MEVEVQYSFKREDGVVVVVKGLKFATIMVVTEVVAEEGVAAEVAVQLLNYYCLYYCFQMVN